MSEVNGISEINGGQEVNAGTHKKLIDSFTRFNKFIPKDGLFEWDENGKIDRQRLFTPESSTQLLENVLNENFSDGNDRQRVAHAAASFLDGLSSGLFPPEEAGVQALSGIDRFLSEFPAKMVEGLGDRMTPDIMVQILGIGTEALNSISQEPENIRRVWQNIQQDQVARLVGSSIPEALGKAENISEFLKDVEKMIVTEDIHDVYRYVEYFQNREPISPEVQSRLQKLDIATSHLMGSGEVISRFDSDETPWSNDRFIGYEKRATTWRDLVLLVRRGLEGGREYGILNIHTSETPVTQYLRGSTDSSVFNGPKIIKNTPSLFVHNHPGQVRVETTPLISHGDLVANDYGGGYLNIACDSGVTMHLGSEMLDEVESEKLKDELGLMNLYTLESGEDRGRKISPFSTFDETADVMKEILEANPENSFSYSISAPIDGMKHHFIHIPWSKLDTDISFQDICFGDGLKRLTAKLGGVPHAPQNQNLFASLVQPRKIAKKIFEQKYGDRAFEK